LSGFKVEGEKADFGEGKKSRLFPFLLQLFCFGQTRSAAHQPSAATAAAVRRNHCRIAVSQTVSFFYTGQYQHQYGANKN
jgi:hypothetical protein